MLDDAGNEIELAPVKLPIVINAKKPVVKFKSSSLTVKPGKEATTTLYLDQKMIWIDSGVQFVGADTKGEMALKEGWFNLNCDASTGKITASLNSSASRPAPTGTYTFLVKTSIMGGELLPAKLTIRVTK